jgi:hypothetical protein
VNTAGIRAQARLHHAWLLGLQLRVSVSETPEVVGEWMFRLFRRQHETKFLSSFEKLGLAGLPHAVACARYHVLSNNVGGVGVEYAEESERKAWVRFRYPRWMYAGPTICGVPVEVSRGFLNGWYAHNGVSLGDPRLGFVCVSEDMMGQFGLCGYFVEEDRDLEPSERLRFAPDELPPDFRRHPQPSLPEADWNEARLEKANRNYALEYLRNGLAALTAVLGAERTREHARHAARLIGLQYQAETAALVATMAGSAGARAAGEGPVQRVGSPTHVQRLHRALGRWRHGGPALDEDAGRASGCRRAALDPHPQPERRLIRPSSPRARLIRPSSPRAPRRTRRRRRCAHGCLPRDSGTRSFAVSARVRPSPSRCAWTEARQVPAPELTSRHERRPLSRPPRRA